MDLPELRALASPKHLIRLPPGDEVPLTRRVMRILDTAPMRRLSRVTQLGLVAQVYPGAVHSRFEHSLGVYRNSLLFLQRLSQDARFVEYVTPRNAEALMVAALVHDIGHWPFCHPIEDLKLADLPEHEFRARQILSSAELSDCFRDDWSIDVEDVLRILEGDGSTPGDQLLASLMSSPLDIDKLDYLQRDSLHAGVPYGRNFDAQRLIGALCVHPEQPKLAITEKGRTAAEMMVFARYIMFSEVYWHHAVRSATAMLQRAIWLLRERIDLHALCRCDEHEWISQLQRTADGTKAQGLVDGLFGPRRKLYKRGAEFNILDQPELHQQLARRPYDRLVIASERLAARIAEQPICLSGPAM